MINKPATSAMSSAGSATADHATPRNEDASAVIHAFISKLRHGAPLTNEEEQTLLALAQPFRRVGSRTDILPEGKEPRSLFLVLEGWACRYKVLENGKRQIIAILLPGDLCEPFGVLPRFVENSLGTLTSVTLAKVALAAVQQAASQSRNIEDALWWDLLSASSMEREHVVSLGRRSASERLGHLFCELHLRLGMVGLVGDNNGYEMPITQGDLGDLLGLSAVHVNRSLQELRRTGLISLRGKHLIINNLQELRDFSLFDPAYIRADGSVWR